MAKAKPPASDDTPPRSPNRSMTAELTARALRAAERPPDAQSPQGEIITEILDQAQLPLDPDEQPNTAPDHDPPRLERRETEKELALPPVPDEDARKAEVLLESFLAAHVRTKDAPAGDQAKGEKQKKESSEASAKKAPKRPPAPRARRPRTTAPIPPPIPGRGGAMHALNHAQPPGVFVIEHQAPGDGLSEEENPALAAAVDEAIGLLFGVRGIHHIGPGQDETGEPVVVVAAGPDFSEAALQQIPESVGDFKTIITLPFDLLPLRRSR